MDFSSLRPSDWAIVVSTLLGPVLAVQAQKWLEGLRAHHYQKQALFQRLMATRGSRLSQQHVEALNMIDLAFYGRRILFFRWQTRTEKVATRLWGEYLDSLSVPNSEVVFARREDCFINMLAAMSDDLGFAFDRVTIKNHTYSPIAHGTLEDQAAAFRVAALEVLHGQRSLKMEIINIPGNPPTPATGRVTAQPPP